MFILIFNFLLNRKFVHCTVTIVDDLGLDKNVLSQVEQALNPTNSNLVHFMQGKSMQPFAGYDQINGNGMESNILPVVKVPVSYAQPATENITPNTENINTNILPNSTKGNNLLDNKNLFDNDLFTNKNDDDNINQKISDNEIPPEFHFKKPTENKTQKPLRYERNPYKNQLKNQNKNDEDLNNDDDDNNEEDINNEDPNDVSNYPYYKNKNKNKNNNNKKNNKNKNSKNKNNNKNKSKKKKNDSKIFSSSSILSDSVSSSDFEKISRPKKSQLPERFTSPNKKETPEKINRRKKLNTQSENFLKKYDIAQTNANDDKKKYYGVKYMETMDNVVSETRDLKKLRKIEEDLSSRFEQYDALKTNLKMIISKLDVEAQNIKNAIEENHEAVGDIKSKIKMLMNEITEMLKKLHSAKTQLGDYREQIKMHEKREQKLSRDAKKNVVKSEINCKKLEEFEHLSKHTESALHGVRHKISALEDKIGRGKTEKTFYKMKSKRQNENPQVRLFLDHYD